MEKDFEVLQNEVHILREKDDWNKRLRTLFTYLFLHLKEIEKTEDVYTKIVNTIFENLPFQNVCLLLKDGKQYIPIAANGIPICEQEPLKYLNDDIEKIIIQFQSKYNVKHTVAETITVRSQTVYLLFISDNKQLPEPFIEAFPTMCRQIELAIDSYEMNQNFEQMELFARENTELVQRMELKVEERTEELQHALKALQETQYQLVQAEKMAALGQLVAGVAHEINTPVGLGVTAVSYLEQQTFEFEDKYKTNAMKRSHLEGYIQNVKESISIINVNLLRAADLIKSFKQVSVDQSNDSVRLFHLKSYIMEVVTSLQPSLKGYKVNIEIECEDHLEIISHPGAISQILTNLIMNTLLHGLDKETRGTIKINVKETRNGIEIIYKDDGKGISSENMKKIFEPFFTTNRSNGGTGLGLHIIYNIVTQTLKGTIHCESRLNNGVMFMIEFPVQKEMHLR